MSTSLIWLWNISFQSLIHSEGRVVWSEILRTRCFGVLEFIVNISSTCLNRHISSNFRGLVLKERIMLPTSSIKERSFPSSSSCEKIIFSPLSLSMRGECSLISKLENPFNTLIVLFSSVMAHSVLVETMETISLWNEVMVSSKSCGLMTIPRLVDEFVLKIVSITDVFGVKSFNSSPNVLSKIVKFVSLSLPYCCCIAFAIWLAYQACPSRHTYHVPF